VNIDASRGYIIIGFWGRGFAWNWNLRVWLMSV